MIIFFFASSTIRFRPTSSDNSVTYACEAEHAALLNPPLRSSVLLSVLRKFVFLTSITKKFAFIGRAKKNLIIILLSRKTTSLYISLHNKF